MSASLYRRLLSTGMNKAPAPLLISAQQLHSALASFPTSVKILDSTWFMPNVTRNALSEYQQKRIPNAQFWDLDEIAATHPLGLKHMLPDATCFQKACSERGIKRDDHVVIYDTHGIFSSPRALFTFRAFGHHMSSVLNGGLPAWTAYGQGVELESSKPIFHATSLYPKPISSGELIRDYKQIVDNSILDLTHSPHAEVVLDARSHGRWTGEDPEPRPNLPSGHIPNSLSVPFTSLLNQNLNPTTGEKYTTLREPAELLEIFRNVAGDERLSEVQSGTRQVICTCGSGMTAAVIWLALQTLDVQSTIYDEVSSQESINVATPESWIVLVRLCSQEGKLYQYLAKDPVLSMKQGLIYTSKPQSARKRNSRTKCFNDSSSNALPS